MNKPLFSDFKPVSAKAWKQKIQVDLKGEDYNTTLISQTLENINIKPFYHQDDLIANSILKTTSTSWLICQDIYVANIKNSNKKAINAIQQGVESIKFIIPNNTISIQELLQDINTNKIQIYFELQFLDANYVNQLTSKNNIYVLTDIIGNLAKTGNWYTNIKTDHEKLEKIATNLTPTISINTSVYQNAGANIVQQLAYSLAHVNEYYNHFKENLKSQITYKISIGSNYFFEIAKLRALRILHKTLASTYNVNETCHIIATPTKRNKTLYDYNTNMLRTTTECMSAIIGGANTISNMPYDAIYHKDNAFGERISKNQLLILKHESYFNEVENPADGSYYIETLTQQLAEKALELFKNIEANGGFLNQLKKGIIQKKINESAAKEQTQFNEGSITLIGTNKYQNKNDKMKDELELYPFLKIKPRKTLIEPILEKRLAETLEQNRLQTE